MPNAHAVQQQRPVHQVVDLVHLQAVHPEEGKSNHFETSYESRTCWRHVADDVVVDPGGGRSPLYTVLETTPELAGVVAEGTWGTPRRFEAAVVAAVGEQGVAGTPAHLGELITEEELRNLVNEVMWPREGLKGLRNQGQ